MRANRTPGSVRGAPGNRCPYLDSHGMRSPITVPEGHRSLPAEPPCLRRFISCWPDSLRSLPATPVDAAESRSLLISAGNLRQPNGGCLPCDLGPAKVRPTLMARSSTAKENRNGGPNLGFEATLWATADKLRGNLAAAAEEAEDDGEPFEQKMKRLTAKLEAQYTESAKLEKAIPRNLELVNKSL